MARTAPMASLADMDRAASYGVNETGIPVNYNTDAGQAFLAEIASQPILGMTSALYA